MDKIFDHIKLGQSLKHFVYPPYGVQDILGFEFALIEIIPQKLNDLLKKANLLKEQKEFELRLIEATTSEGSLERYFWATFVFHTFSEYYFIQKWLNYWLALWYKLSPNDLPQSEIRRKLNQISDSDIQRAKQSPIQNYYDGQLRRNANRLVGLCLFHSEKTPSLNIFLDTNTYYCFGCQARGDSISFIQETKNLSFPEAVRFLL